MGLWVSVVLPRGRVSTACCPRRIADSVWRIDNSATTPAACQHPGPRSPLSLCLEVGSALRADLAAFRGLRPRVGAPASWRIPIPHPLTAIPLCDAARTARSAVPTSFHVCTFAQELRSVLHFCTFLPPLPPCPPCQRVPSRASLALHFIPRTFTSLAFFHATLGRLVFTPSCTTVA